MTTQFDGQSVIITGAGKGIGRDCAIEMANRVYIHQCRPDQHWRHTRRYEKGGHLRFLDQLRRDQQIGIGAGHD